MENAVYIFTTNLDWQLISLISGIERLLDKNIIEKHGTGSGTQYTVK